MNDNFEFPTSYEECIKLKKELLDKINEYNEALLLDKPLPYTEEEIDLFQERYELLNDELKLTEEEKISKLDPNDIIVNDDGTISKKQTIWDKINIFVLLYTIIGFIGSSGIFTKSIGDACMKKSILNSLEKMYNESKSYEIIQESMMSEATYYFKFFLSFLWFPLALILLSVIVYFVYKLIFKKKDINLTILKYFIFVNIVFTIVSVLIIMLTCTFKNYKEIYDHYDAYYTAYVYNQLGGGYI